MIASPEILLAGACGPLRVTVRAADAAIAQVAQDYLTLFSMPWRSRTRPVNVDIVRAMPAARARGTFLSAAHMTVDAVQGGYFADTQYGFTARGDCGASSDEWFVTVPPDTVFGEPQIGDMEDVFSLICTAGWRAEGFTPIHAGAIVKDGTCAILCAPSGGGKSTLTAAMVLNGWSTLGDDKLLLRHEHGAPVLSSLLQTFNLDPASRRWFHFDEIAALPRYSAWTDKRRVTLDFLRSGAGAESARPTHIVNVERDAASSSIHWSPMDRAATAAALLRQIVLPADASAVRALMSEAMRLVANVKGLHLRVGHDAYAQPGWLADVERALG